MDVALLRMHVHGCAQASLADGYERGTGRVVSRLKLDCRAVKLVCGKHASVETAKVLAVQQEGFLLAGRDLFE